MTKQGSYHYDKAGKLYESILIRDRNHQQYNQSTTYYTNGKVASVCYYYVRDRSFYARRLMDSTYTQYDSTGHLISRERYHVGKLHGKSQYFFPNGQLSAELRYQENRLMGATYYDADGQLFPKPEFSEGNGKLYMYELGVLVRYCMYKNGKPRKCDCEC